MASGSFAQKSGVSRSDGSNAPRAPSTSAPHAVTSSRGSEPFAKRETPSEPPEVPSIPPSVSPAAAFAGLSPEDAAWTPAQWFVAPSYASPGRYQAIPTNMVFTKSCEARKDELVKQDMGTRVRTALGVDATKPFPGDVRIETLSQFYSFEGRYFQVSMVATGATPAVYEMSLVAASHPRFEGDGETLPISGVAPNTWVDTPSALALVARTLEEAKAKGALEGARAMSVRAQSPSGETHAVEAQNGRIVGYSQAGLNCLYARSDNALKCVCGF